MSKCESLAKELETYRRKNVFHLSNSTTDGERTVTYSKTWIPSMGTYNNYFARNANELEKSLFERSKNEKADS